MYQNAALLALLSFLYVLISGRVERSWLSGPILFVAGGFLLGPGGLAVLSLEMTAEGLRLLAELTLAMVLFSDAATAGRSVTSAMSPKPTASDCRIQTRLVPRQNGIVALTPKAAPDAANNTLAGPGLIDSGASAANQAIAVLVFIAGPAPRRVGGGQA